MILWESEGDLQAVGTRVRRSHHVTADLEADVDRLHVLIAPESADEQVMESLHGVNDERT